MAPSSFTPLLGCSAVPCLKTRLVATPTHSPSQLDGYQPCSPCPTLRRTALPSPQFCDSPMPHFQPGSLNTHVHVLFPTGLPHHLPPCSPAPSLGASPISLPSFHPNSPQIYPLGSRDLLLPSAAESPANPLPTPLFGERPRTPALPRGRSPPAATSPGRPARSAQSSPHTSRPCAPLCSDGASPAPDPFPRLPRGMIPNSRPGGSPQLCPPASP